MATSSPSQRLLVIDGTALAFRAFFAIRNLTDGQGRPSGALYGYISSLLRALEDHPADFIAVAWDRPEPTFRHQLDPNYKANREDLDEDLRVQFPWMREITDALGLPSLSMAGFEADDILASLAVQNANEDKEVRLFTSDKDLAQVVAPNILQCPPPKSGASAVVLGPKEIEEKYGLPPARMAEWQALVGDSSDNIKGMPGVGPKRATALLQKYASMEELLQRGPAEEKGKLAENLATFAEDVRLALRLVTMRTDLEVGTPESLAPKPPNFEQVLEFCEAHGFQTLGKRFQEFRCQGGLPGNAKRNEEAPLTPAPSKKISSAQRMERGDYRCIESWSELEDLRLQLQQSAGFAFDTETTDIDPMRARLVGMSFCWQAGQAWYVPMNAPTPLQSPDGKDVLEFLRPVLENSSLPKYGQNCKYDAHVMQRHGIHIRGWEFDTMIAHFLVDPLSRHNLDAIALQIIGMEKIPTKELLGTGKHALTMDLVPIQAVAEYACEDADATFQLVDPLRQGLAKVGAMDLFRQVEMPLMKVLQSMEAEGIRVDRERLLELRKSLGQRQLEMEALVHQQAGERFNLNSPKQLGPILFEKLKIQDAAGVKRVGRTKTGYKTDATTLARYAGVPIVDALLEYRQLTKLIGTYVDALPSYIHPQTGHIHSSFHQAVASTGRLSSSDPNLQNIPIRSEAGRAIRRAFIPRADDWVLVSADYSQVELRVVAHLSQDPALLQAFREDADVHARTAALVFQVAEKDVDPAMRSRAKAINFGILYGMGPQRLARETGLSMQEARDFIDAYFSALPGVRAWLDQTLETARAKGEVRTLLGRHRPTPDVNSADGRVRSAAENVAVNTPVQGSAADLIKVAMLRVDEQIRKQGLAARMILQVHDELVFDCPQQELDALQALVKKEMEHAWKLDVPLKVDLGYGPDWSSAH